LIVSTAAGIVVTRVSTDEDFGQQVASQLGASAYPLFLAGVILAVLGVLPGMPHFAFLTLAVAFIAVGYMLYRRAKAEQAEALRAKVAAEAPSEEVSWTDVPVVEPLSLELGYRLIRLVDAGDQSDLIKRIRADFPSTRVLVLTMHTSDQFAVRAFRSGASGFLTKDSAADQLVLAIRKIASGGAYVPHELAERMAVGLQGLNDAPPHQQLSNREFEVYRHIMAGKRLTDIAGELHLSIKTVSTHKAHIMEKLGVAGTASLVRYGLQHHLFEEHAAQAALLLEEATAAEMRTPLSP